MNIMTNTRHTIESGHGGSMGHFLIESKKFAVLVTNKEVYRNGDFSELFPERGLRSGAHTVEGFGKFDWVISMAAIEKFWKARMVSQGHEEFSVVP